MPTAPSLPPPVCVEPCASAFRTHEVCPKYGHTLTPFCADEIYHRKNAVRISDSDITSAEFRRAIPNVRISDGCNQTDEIRRVAA